MVKLSVIVPVYKVERFIRKCVDSLVFQSYPNMEIILVDDGSPDDCPQICDDYAKRDKRIKVVHQNNRGVAEARNAGVKMATGEYVCFVDSDDFLQGEMIKQTASIIMQEPNIDIIIYDYFVFLGENDKELTRCYQRIDSSWTADKIRDEFLLDHYPNYMWNKVFRKELLQCISVPSGIWMEDLYACASLFSMAKNIRFVPEAYYCYRNFESTYSKQAKTKKKYGMFMAWREHERVCAAGGFSPLAYSRERARKAAISLKIINYAEDILTKEQKTDLDEYLRKIDSTASLPIKYRFEHWADAHLPKFILKQLGYMSVWAERRKR